MLAVTRPALASHLQAAAPVIGASKRSVTLFGRLASKSLGLALKLEAERGDAPIASSDHLRWK